jgi:hypothetical protein
MAVPGKISAGPGGPAESHQTGESGNEIAIRPHVVTASGGRHDARSARSNNLAPETNLSCRHLANGLLQVSLVAPAGCV